MIYKIQKVLIKYNLAKTNGECDRYLQSNIIKVNGNLANQNSVISRFDFTKNNECVISRGKNTKVTITLDEFLEW